MTAPLVRTAGDSTPGRLRVIDLNQTFPLNTLSPVWAPIQYIESSDFNPDDAVMVDAAISGDQGWGGQDKLGASWKLTMVLNHMIVPGSNPPIYDPTHDFLESRAIGSFGRANRIQLRIYDFDLSDPTGVITPRGQAYMGFCNFTFPGFGSTGITDARKVTVECTGKGPLNKIAHPYPLTPTVPVITSIVAPSSLATAGGDLVTIYGSGFTSTVATTGVKFAGTNAAKWTVNSDNEIVAITPAHAAGSGPVLVTNTAGPSTTGPNVTFA